MSYAGESLGLRRVVAITDVENQNSIRLLEKIGFRHERMVKLSDDAPELKLFASDV